MMVGKNRGIKPLLLKFGVALALSFAGFLYSRLRTRRINPSPPPPSDKESEVDSGVRPQRQDGLNATRTAHSSRNLSIASEKYEEIYMPKVSVVNCTSGISACSKHSEDKDGLLLPEFNALVKEFDLSAANSGFSPKKNAENPRSYVATPKAFRTTEKDEYEQEIRHLRDMVRMLRERERNLEVQLLEYYGLKEQETAVMELQNRLRISSMEAKLLTLKIESLQGDNRRLEAQVADHAKVVAELEATRAKIKMLKKKLRFEAEQNKEQILILKQRVAKLHDDEAGASNSELEMKLRRLRELEGESEELRKSNLKLQLENSELARRLESTQILANSVLEYPEAEALKEKSERLRHENENLTKEIEQLQLDRCSDVEELVYLRWINACLRYELRNFQPPSGKTVARDLSKSLSLKSEEKAKQLIVEYANTEGMGDKGIINIDFDSDQCSSSLASAVMDYSPDLFDFSVDNSSATKTNFSVDDSSAMKTNTLSKNKLFSKLRRIVLGKDTPYQNQVSSADKTGYAEDNYSPFCSSSKSTAAYAGPEGQSNIYATPCHGSSRASLDILRWRSPKDQDIKDMHSFQRHNSDMGSLSGYKRFILGSEGSADSPFKDRFDQESDSTEKSPLVKYAEALMGSRSRSGTPEVKVHKKSASAS